MVFPLIKATGKIAVAPVGHEPPGRGSQTEFGNHCTPITPGAAVGEMVTGPVISGRNVARPVSELAFAAGIVVPMAPTFPANNVTGLPLCDCVISDSCHPSLN